MRIFTIALLLLGASAFTSCNKEDKSNPATPVVPVENKTIESSQLLGRWEVISFYQLITADSSGAVLSAAGYSQTYHDNGIRYDPEYASYITFNADKTFDHANKDNTGGSTSVGLLLKQHGTYEIKNADTALSLLTILSDSTISMQDYKVVAFRSDYFHILLQTNYVRGKTFKYHLEFKK